MFCGVAKGLPRTINFAQDTTCEEWETSSNGLCYLPACDEGQTKCLRDEKEYQVFGLGSSAELKCYYFLVHLADTILNSFFSRRSLYLECCFMVDNSGLQFDFHSLPMEAILTMYF
ncbi:hypothetical protein K7432_001011 [Basidiobolus ranarum]|uniref:Uncharacterized protein n=1 Tax=Basidiobolus ranarum TaxID=34480 RepID=A0ABR2X3U4_9FUNG